MSYLPSKLSFFNYDKAKSVLHSITPLIIFKFDVLYDELLSKCHLIVSPKVIILTSGLKYSEIQFAFTKFHGNLAIEDTLLWGKV